MKSVYQRLKEAGAEMSNHYSDLYVKATPKNLKIVRQARKDGVFTCSFSYFQNQVDKERWIDIPFQFDPYWEKKMAQKERVKLKI